MLTSVTQLAAWWLLASASARHVSGLISGSQVPREPAICWGVMYGPAEENPDAETPSWFPRQRWAEELSLEAFYCRWGARRAWLQTPDVSPGGQPHLTPGWPERLREKIPEWTRRDPGLGDHDAAPATFTGKVNSQVDGPWGSLKAKLEVDPAELRDAERWQAEQNLQIPVAGPLYVFGQVKAGCNTWTAQERTLAGRTGIGCNLRPVAGSEIILSGGSQTNYTEDPLQPKRLPVEKSQLILELQANYSLLGALKLEYQGSATPALDPLDRNRVQHDFRFAVPLGRAGDLRLGAKHQWEEQPGATRTSWSDGMQLYLGIGLKR